MPGIEELGELLAAAGIKSAGSEILLSPVGNGRNNQIVKVTTAGRSYVCKVYFRDSRDRLDSECRFLAYAAACGIDCVPVFLARDDCRNAALMSFLDGMEVREGEIDESMVLQAGRFVAILNGNHELAEEHGLPDGAEACFSIDAHILRTEQRVSRLSQLDVLDDLDFEAVRFVRETLVPQWEAAKESMRRVARSLGLDTEGILARRQRCISPSDVGFHNALLGNQRQVMFVDFEYAGWDDPAKLACDFRLQVDLPVPSTLYDVFIREALAPFPDKEAISLRIDLLMPVYRIKWACILLNEFLDDGWSRRKFAFEGRSHEHPVRLQRERDRGGAAGASTRSIQLRKAISLVG